MEIKRNKIFEYEYMYYIKEKIKSQWRKKGGFVESCDEKSDKSTRNNWQWQILEL